MTDPATAIGAAQLRSPGLGAVGGTLCRGPPCLPHPRLLEQSPPGPGLPSPCGTTDSHCSFAVALDTYGQALQSHQKIQQDGFAGTAAFSASCLTTVFFLKGSWELLGRAATGIAFTEHRKAEESLESKPKPERAKVSNSNTCS